MGCFLLLKSYLFEQHARCNVTLVEYRTKMEMTKKIK